jgi:VCBS repeat protein
MFRIMPAIAVVVLASAPLVPAEPAPQTSADGKTITWKKIVLDTKFRSEGVAIADVNKDGKIDVLNGEYWYEAPDWKPHEMQPYMDHKDGLGNYSRSFACWCDDFNGDGWPDLIVIDFPGQPCYWMENPQGKDTHWKKHTIWHSACNETPIYADLFGNGKRVLVMAWQPKGKEAEGQMAYFTPNSKDPTGLWEMHPISEMSTPPEMKDGKPVPGTGKEMPGTRRFSHGLGVGDVNSDGRLDVITSGATTGGVGAWWEQPANPDGKSPWKMHPLQAPDACADMFAYDMDGDGKNDILSTSAHRFGIWWHKQRSSDKEPSFQRMDLFPKLVSETHAVHFKDLDGDGRPDLITGKRWWSHGRSEPGSDGPAIIYWFKNTKGPDGMAQFTPLTIDSDSGIGTQFEVADINGDGLLDVITSNKKGVRVILQERN